MDINKLLNPSARGPAGPYDSLDEESGHVHSSKSSSTSSRVSRQTGTPRGPSDEHARYHKYATIGSSSAGSMTARSSISSLSSFQSSASLTTMSSTGSISKGSLGSPIRETLGRPKPDFKIPIYGFDVTQISARPVPRGLYTPSESDCSPSTTAVSQYFPSYSDPTQDRCVREELAGSGLNTLAALATSQDLKQHPLKTEHVDITFVSPSAPYEGASSCSYVSQLRQRADLVPKQTAGFKHISSQDVYAMSKLQLSSTPGMLSPPGSGSLSPTPTASALNLDAEPQCSYVEDCNTMSPLRKVVSHIFGRNKLSTRQIPRNIWVYYCRKHYQRSRYRDLKGFAKLQCDLVQKQVDRLDAWGGVEDWVIKVRRREEIRISKENKAAVSRGSGLDDFDEDDCSRRSSLSQGSSDSHWISHMTGAGKTIKDVRFLLQRIEIEIIDRGGVFPDVEILPNVRPSAIAGDMSTLSGASESGHSLGPILEGSKSRRPRGSLIDAFISPRKQLPSRRSLEEAMVVTGSTVSAQAKLQKSSRPAFAQEFSPPSMDEDDNYSRTRPKRKASKPLPITVLPPDEVSYMPENYHGYGYPDLSAHQATDPAAEHEKLMKFRSKRARPGITGFPNYPDGWQGPLSPVPSRRNSLDLESDNPPLPVLAEKVEEQLRSPSMEDVTLNIPIESSKTTGEAFCAFEQKDLKIVLVTPPPSAYGDCPQASGDNVELTADGEIDHLGVYTVQPLLALDSESDRPVLAIEVPQHVRDFVMGSWSRKRAVRMKNLFGDQIARPTESTRLVGYQSRDSRRKSTPSGKSSLPKRAGGQAQDYVEYAKETVRSRVRNLRTSFALQSEPTAESSSMEKRKSFSLLTKCNQTPPIAPSSRRRSRASSAGPAGRSSSSNMPVRRTLTIAPPKAPQEPSRTWTRGSSNSRPN
ncbi:hypothetical protein Dda_7662 [Drechslerella dactyloides]|uniref:Uncharacterized protein n=1 Tax=Drechslerella dactyloides TaxID=74499 RepID=A0AAD6NII5_DREDA|nr:hypothetical protein Dda_7662 [Drechslerella dactyloides]